jgi:hypothetical protein
MPYEIALDGLLGGFVIKGARAGEQMEISPAGFLSTEDGGRFVTCLEHAGAVIINALPPTAKVWPPTVDHLLTIFRRDKTATVYVNELSIEVRARPKRALQAGENVYDDNWPTFHTCASLVSLFPMMPATFSCSLTGGARV